MAWTTSVHANPYNKTNKTITHHTGGESYGRYTQWNYMDFIHSTWLLVRRSDDLCKQNYYWSDGNIVDQKIYTWLYVWLGINSDCYYKVFDFSLNKSR